MAPPFTATRLPSASGPITRDEPRLWFIMTNERGLKADVSPFPDTEQGEKDAKRMVRLLNDTYVAGVRRAQQAFRKTIGLSS